MYSIIDQPQTSLNGDAPKPIIQLRRGRKPGRKAKRRPTSHSKKDSETDLGDVDLITAADGEQGEEAQPIEVETKVPVESSNGAVGELIDSLVSPLKVDNVFGKLRFISSIDSDNFLVKMNANVFLRKMDS